MTNKQTKTESWFVCPPRELFFWMTKFDILHTHMFNKTFYKFLFSFIAVVAGVLLFILILGTTSPS
jgi:hypothetical protein